MSTLTYIRLFSLQVVEEEAAKRIELLVKKKVEEELEKRKDEIEQEVAKRVEEAKRRMEKEMMEELERQREHQRREEMARQVTARPGHQSCATANNTHFALTHDQAHTTITINVVLAALIKTQCTVQCFLIPTLYDKLIRELFRSYLLKVQSGVVRVTLKNFLFNLFQSQFMADILTKETIYSFTMHVSCTWRQFPFSHNCKTICFSNRIAF